MQDLNRSSAGAPPPPPQRLLQFGGGNFLRGFADWIVEVYNRKYPEQALGVIVANNSDRKIYRQWREQEGLYHVLTRGLKDGKTVDTYDLVTNVSRVLSLDQDWEVFLKTAEDPAMRYIISNTTEAGIRFSPSDGVDDAPPAEFPAKLTQWLHRRFDRFAGDADRGCIILPMELIADNGAVLRETVLKYCDHWSLSPDFADWVRNACTFCNTLVDRIVPGVGEGELASVQQTLGYRDAAVTQGEPYHLLAIEAPQKVREELPLDQLGLNIVYTDDLSPYRLSKVRILNGAHTSMVPVGFLSGRETVGQTVEREPTAGFVRGVIYDEIIPTLELPGVDLEQFARDVLDRFGNPFIEHRLLSISLNSVSKFRERVLPTMLAYLDQKDQWPPRLTLSLAALIRFYRGDYAGSSIPLRDDDWVIEFMSGVWKDCDGSQDSVERLVGKALAWKRAWGEDLSGYRDLRRMVTTYLLTIEEEGMEAAISGTEN